MNTKIEMKAVEDIKPYERNPRINDKAVQFVANSIREFGFRQPIVVDKEMVIIVGHTRWKASQLLGLKEVPVIVADDLSEEQVKAYRIADNSVADVSSWDYDMLDIEMKDLPDFSFDDFAIVTQEFDWSDTKGIEEGGYEKPADPEKPMYTCPFCGKSDLATKFKHKQE